MSDRMSNVSDSRRAPAVATDSVAQDQIRAFVDRILRMRAEAQAIKDDIKEIYAEAKGNGFDKTVLGNVVRYLEKTSDDHAKEDERDALFDLYLNAYQGAPSRTHAHAREDDEHKPALTHAADGADAQPVGTAEELQPGSSASIQIGAPRGVEGEAEGASASPANTTIIPFSAKPLRPYCLRPDHCGGYGRKHCGLCERSEGFGRPLTVEVGGVDVPHHGDVA